MPTQARAMCPIPPQLKHCPLLRSRDRERRGSGGSGESDAVAVAPLTGRLLR
jgi:hypothetical protein